MEQNENFEHVNDSELPAATPDEQAASIPEKESATKEDTAPEVNGSDVSGSPSTADATDTVPPAQEPSAPTPPKNDAPSASQQKKAKKNIPSLYQVIFTSTL